MNSDRKINWISLYFPKWLLFITPNRFFQVYVQIDIIQLFTFIEVNTMV